MLQFLSHIILTFEATKYEDLKASFNKSNKSRKQVPTFHGCLLTHYSVEQFGMSGHLGQFGLFLGTMITLRAQQACRICCHSSEASVKCQFIVWVSVKSKLFQGYGYVTFTGLYHLITHKCVWIVFLYVSVLKDHDREMHVLARFPCKSNEIYISYSILTIDTK